MKEKKRIQQRRAATARAARAESLLKGSDTTSWETVFYTGASILVPLGLVACLVTAAVALLDR